jgi:hypothetical protein
VTITARPPSSAASGENDCGAGAVERLRDRAADAARSPRHQRMLSGQIEHDVPWDGWRMMTRN